jgi:hypothetical protein
MAQRIEQRVMTLEEALHLSALRDDPQERFERPSIWAWQTVARTMAQTVSSAQLDAMARKPTARVNRYGRRQAG